MPLKEEGALMPFHKILFLALCLAGVTWVSAQNTDPAPPKGRGTMTEQEPKIAERAEDKVILPGAKIYVAPMENGFETYIVAGMVKKKVPVTMVNDRSQADFEITGVSDTERAGWAKMLFLGTDRTNENASIKLTNLRSGLVVWGYSVHKGNSARGKQSAGEACAKHLNKKIESKR